VEQPTTLHESKAAQGVGIDEINERNSGLQDTDYLALPELGPCDYPLEEPDSFSQFDVLPHQMDAADNYQIGYLTPSPSTFSPYAVTTPTTTSASTSKRQSQVQNDWLTPRDTSMDQFLIDCKDKGMSYKDIRVLGGFREAESTLRGRYRTLTKPKEERVRRPQWSQRDVSTHAVRNSVQLAHVCMIGPTPHRRCLRLRQLSQWQTSQYHQP
jgi:hypothetical protein